MKLFMRKDISDVGTRFSVYDETDCLRYKVTGCKKSLTEIMVVSTRNGVPMLTIKVAPMHFAHLFSIRDENERFYISVWGGPQNPVFRFHGISWRIDREPIGRSFQLVDADSSVVMIQDGVHFITDGYYILDVKNDSRELFCVATAVCADLLNFIDVTQTASV